MTHTNTIVSIFNRLDQAEEAVKQLNHAGLELPRMSLVGRGFHTEQHVVGYYTAGDRMKAWGANGALWGGIWGLLFGSAFFMVPGIGPLMIAGPLVMWIVGALEGAVLVGGVSVLGAALYSVGIPKDSILQYETAVKADKVVLVVTGTTEELTRAEMVLNGSAALHTYSHLTALGVAAPV